MTATAVGSTGLTDSMKERIRLHKEEVARLREEFPDPAAALSAFVLEHFELAALIPVNDVGEPLDPGMESDEDDLDAW